MYCRSGRCRATQRPGRNGWAQLQWRRQALRTIVHKFGHDSARVPFPIEPRSYGAMRFAVVDLDSHSETVSVLGPGEGTEWLWAAQFSLADDWPRVCLLGRLAGRRRVDRRRRETPLARNRVGTRDFAGLRSQLLKVGFILPRQRFAFSELPVRVRHSQRTQDWQLSAVWSCAIVRT